MVKKIDNKKIINKDLSAVKYRYKKEKLLKYLVGIVILFILIFWIFWITNSDSWSGRKKENNTLIKSLQKVSNNVGSDIFEFKNKSKQEIDKIQTIKKAETTKQNIIDNIKKKIANQSAENENNENIDTATTTIKN